MLKFIYLLKKNQNVSASSDRHHQLIKKLNKTKYNKIVLFQPIENKMKIFVIIAILGIALAQGNFIIMNFYSKLFIYFFIDLFLNV